MGAISDIQHLALLEKEKDTLRRSANQLIVLMGRAEDFAQVELLSRQLRELYERLDLVTARICELISEERSFMLNVARQVRLRKAMALQPDGVSEPA